MTPADVEARGLRASRAGFLTGVPGSGPSYELLDACERAGIHFIPSAHEAAGVIMAGAAARQTGAIGAALSIKGPGVANLVGGMALARFENYPVITFSEAYAPDASPGLQHKRMPQDGMLAAAAKQVCYRGAVSIEQLAMLACEEPAGPVHLNLVEGPARVEETPKTTCDREVLARVVDRIRRARRPIVICGSALTRPGRERVERPFLKGLRIPVFSTAAAKGVLDEHDPASAGVYTGAGAEQAPERRLLPQADLIVGLGLRNVEVLGARPFSAPYVSVDTCDAVFQAGFNPDAHARVPLDTSLEPVLDALRLIEWGLDEVARAHAALAVHLDRSEFLPAPCYATLARIAGARLVTDSGNFTIIAEHVWRASSPSEFVGSSNGRYMGAGLPQAIGAALVAGGSPIVCTSGDGGLPPFIAELRIAIERQLPLLLVLMTDGHYGSMRARVLSRGFTQAGIHLTHPSWLAAVEGLGCAGERVTTRDAFDAAVARWKPEGGPRFIEAVMPDRPYVDMVGALRQ